MMELLPNIPSQKVADMLNCVVDHTEEKFMQSWEEKEYYEEIGYQKGYETGIETGIENSRREMIQNFLQNGGTKEMAKKMLCVTEDEIDKACVMV